MTANGIGKELPGLIEKLQNMGSKSSFITKSMKMLKMLSKGKSSLKNGEGHGN